MVSRKGVASEAAEMQRGELDFNAVYETYCANGDRTHIPEDPTYMAVDDLELLLEQNMLVARHRGHSMPAWSTNQDMEKELVDPANKYNR
jgi:hypothetical protein